MRAYIRRALVPAVAISAVLLTGCSSEGDSTDAAPKQEPASEVPIDPADLPEKSPSSSSPEAPVVKAGETKEFGVGETDEYGENYKVTTKMAVTVEEAKYVTPAEVGTTNEPERGQFVRLTLTLKNVGDAPAEIMLYGMMQWEDADTAAQDASTLEGVGEGPELDTTYKPGQSVTGTIVLDVGAKGGTVSYVGTEDPQAKAAFVVELPTS
ncbi:DUF4352 domain-containing protein [Streptomyces sp. ISL-12]|uniref:DUF4352 domain-containing protein n=1 Tax=Streptomyces sp. ISL-12 TaxID=2819177 RepID=UPI001BEA1C58|nr:DUF4352 domain-containing protein [Streptomyces sp. ISL-12]MBT2412621.1 DUF4352 domain-containing protein [Streptomyces sp. ISL-12]